MTDLASIEELNLSLSLTMYSTEHFAHVISLGPVLFPKRWVKPKTLRGGVPVAWCQSRGISRVIILMLLDVNKVNTNRWSDPM